MVGADAPEITAEIRPIQTSAFCPHPEYLKSFRNGIWSDFWLLSASSADYYFLASLVTSVDSFGAIDVALTGD